MRTRARMTCWFLSLLFSSLLYFSQQLIAAVEISTKLGLSPLPDSDRIRKCEILENSPRKSNTVILTEKSTDPSQP